MLSSSVESVKKTKEAVELLKTVKAYADIVKVSNSRKVRAGKGKMRNRRHRQRRGPLVVYEKDDGLVKAFRNIPGVETSPVSALNLLQLAPGGHVGRFIIWTEGAVKALDQVYAEKSGFELPTAKITASDVTRLINSDEIQSIVRPAGQATQKSEYPSKAFTRDERCADMKCSCVQGPSPRRRTPSRTRPSSSVSTLTPRPCVVKSCSSRRRPRRVRSTCYFRLSHHADPTTRS